mgnify:CR=1 FL=1
MRTVRPQHCYEEAGLKVTHGYAYDDNVEKDHVISSDPVAGTEVEEGSTAIRV